MPYFAASASGFPGVGEATATTSASSGMIWNEAAWMSASNREPMIPTFTLPGMGAPPLGLSECDGHYRRAGPGCQGGAGDVRCVPQTHRPPRHCDRCVWGTHPTFTSKYPRPEGESTPGSRCCEECSGWSDPV